MPCFNKQLIQFKLRIFKPIMEQLELLLVDQLLSLLLLIEVVLQPPALEPSASIRELGDDVPRFHPKRLFLGVTRDHPSRGRGS